ncbi:MAG: hypothetical protein KQH57_08045 [Actinomycetales bacterium]|nr:hypothetical protein [Actinomycetales bacterium]
MLPTEARLLPSCLPEFRTAVVGEDYHRKAHRAASRALFDVSVKERDDDGEVIRVASTTVALVPEPDNDWNDEAVAVVFVGEDGVVSLENRIGYVPDRRCATAQPRIVALTRLFDGPVLTRAWATFCKEDGWLKSSAEFRIDLVRWEQLTEHLLAVSRRLEPDVEQPLVGHFTPLTGLARRLYDEDTIPDEYGLVPVLFELHGADLVAVYGGEVLTNISAGGRDFADLLRTRVEQNGAVRGWVRLHEGGVETMTESRPR